MASRRVTTANQLLHLPSIRDALMLHEGIERIRGIFPPFVRTRGHIRTDTRRTHRLRKLGLWVGGVVAALIVIIVAGSFAVDAPLRRYMESTLNHKLKGYSVRLPAVSFHPLGFSLTLEDMVITQDAHPRPPVADIHALTAGVEWRALLHGRLVADFLFERPKLHVDLTQVKTEAQSKTRLKDRGWQDALEAIYPLKINRFRIRDGELTYVDKDPKQPMKISELRLLAENIRNIRSPDHVYPSKIHMQAAVFDTGRVQLDGNANFLEEPFASIDGDVVLRHVELKELKPVASHANLRVTEGVLDLDGHVEYAPHTEVFRLKDLVIRGVNVAYIHAPQTQNREARQVQATQQAAKELSNKPQTLVRVDNLRIEHSWLGYIDETKDPPYRVFFSDADVEIKNFSNQADLGAAGITVRGQFMDYGPATLRARFMPVGKQPDFDLDLQIQPTPLQTLNNVFRAYGNFDVESGTFALYSQLGAHNGEITGYVKPLFQDMHVYDFRTDGEKSLFHQLYEGLVGGVADLLKNPSGTVATKADVSGSVNNPQTSTWEVALRLVQNAFFKAILPGFESHLEQGQGSRG